MNGGGKTYFINKIIEKYSKPDEEIKKNEIIYLSLFGIGQTSEIDGLIFQKLHPILSSQGLKIASTFLRVALKLGINFDYNNDNKNDGSINLGGVPTNNESNKIKIKELEKKLIIVDDIERTSLSPSQIFGYFS